MADRCGVDHRSRYAADSVGLPDLKDIAVRKTPVRLPAGELGGETPKAQVILMAMTLRDACTDTPRLVDFAGLDRADDYRTAQILLPQEALAS